MPAFPQSKESDVQTIFAAADLIAEFDPALANAFVTQPFNRHAIVTALHKSLMDSNFESKATEIAMVLRAAIDANTNTGA